MSIFEHKQSQYEKSQEEEYNIKVLKHLYRLWDFQIKLEKVSSIYNFKFQ
ncbi:MAG: hypothetical protein ACTJH9_00825 [Pseudoalteromonas sp.]